MNISVPRTGLAVVASWGAGVALRSFAAQGPESDSTGDSWRAYIAEVAGPAIVPEIPSQPYEPVRGTTLALGREVLVVDGDLRIDGVAVPSGTFGPLRTGATIDGAGRAVIIDTIHRLPEPTVAELVQLRAERPVRGASMWVVAGRVAVKRRFRVMDVYETDRVELDCRGTLRRGNEPPQLVLVGPRSRI